MQGLTLAQAETINCQATEYGDAFGDGTDVSYWGDNGEVWFDITPATKLGVMLTLWPGYVGTLSFKSPDQLQSYTIGIYTTIQKNGQPYTLESGWTGATFEAEIDELSRGLIATFAPQVPQARRALCRASARWGSSEQLGTSIPSRWPSLSGSIRRPPRSPFRALRRGSISW